MWARIEGEHVLEYSEYKVDSPFEAIKWVEIPKIFTDLGFKDLKVEKDKIVPQSLDVFKEKLYALVKEQRKAYRDKATITYKNHEYYVDEGSFNTLTSKLNVASVTLEKAEKGSKGKYKTVWKSKTGFVDLVQADVAHIIKEMDEFVDGLFVKESEFNEKIKSKTKYEDCVKAYETVNFAT